MENMAFIKMSEYQELLKKSKDYDDASSETRMFTEFLKETGRLTHEVLLDYEKWKNKPKMSTLTDLSDLTDSGIKRERR